MKINVIPRRSPCQWFIAPAWLLLVLIVPLLTGCGAGQSPPAQAAVDIHRGDACAVCGMDIEAGPGPRAEAWVQGYKSPLKFGSTRDFFAYVLDPENTMRLQQLLVQDSERITWQHPSNEAQTFVDARAAWYVAWQPLHGLMGPTFASFAERRAAENFVRAHGGEVLAFSSVTPEMTSLLGYVCPVKGSPAFALARNCVSTPHSDGSSLGAQDEEPELLRRANAAPHEIDPGQQGQRHALLDGKVH